jgi:hypothetical protein
VAEGGRPRRERQQRWNFNDISYGKWKQGRGGDGVHPFFEGKRGEEVRRLHGLGGGRHNEEQCSGRGGLRRRLVCGGQR